MQLDHGRWLAELFHGPTLSFKDLALQLVGRLFDHVLERRGERITIVGATSGDTGSAAIEAVRACRHIDAVILYPHGGTSEVQRRQMTTVDAPNICAVAVEGTFDDCQDLVKAMFADTPFREQMRLAAVNSINWARIMAQIVYYVTAVRSLAGPVTCCVPTGNFGNVFAGWVARRMGTPIADFVIATNANDILARFVDHGDMSVSEVVPTLSPSMDIQVSSNFERMLWVINDGNGRAHRRADAAVPPDRAAGRRRGVPPALDRRSVPGSHRQRRGDAGRDAPRARRNGSADRPAHGDRDGGSAAPGRRVPGPDDGHGAPGQVPRRR